MARPKAIAEIKDGSVYILQAGTPVYFKTADICSITGKSNQWIGQLTSQGTLFKKQTPYGQMYELQASIQNYISNIEDRIECQNDDDKKIEQQRKKAEATLKAAKASIASMEAKERVGKMHRAEDVAALTEDLVYTIRSALLALPSRLTLDVVSAKDAAQASEIIQNEVYKIMDELSTYKYDATKYQERVRERLNMDVIDTDTDDES